MVLRRGDGVDVRGKLHRISRRGRQATSVQNPARTGGSSIVQAGNVRRNSLGGRNEGNLVLSSSLQRFQRFQLYIITVVCGLLSSFS